MKKRILALAMSLVMVFSISAPAFAVEVSGDSSVPTESAQASDPTSEGGSNTEGSSDTEGNPGTEGGSGTEESNPTNEPNTCAECGEIDGHKKTCSSYEKVCTCTPVDGVHQEGCDFYEEPKTPGETCECCGVELTDGAVHAANCLTRCTCDPKPAEGEKHTDKDCPFYVKECTCETTNGIHAEGCDFYVEPVTAAVYTKSEDVYTAVEQDEDSPLNVEEYNGQTIYVLPSDTPQNVYFLRKTWLGLAGAYFSLNEDGSRVSALNSVKEGVFGDKSVAVTLAPDLEVGTTIILTAGQIVMDGSYAITIEVIEKLPDANQILAGNDCIFCGAAEGELHGEGCPLHGIPVPELPDEPTPAVNFTNVAPFGPAVTGAPAVRRVMRSTLAKEPAPTDNGMKINKIATANSDGTYTVSLEAYATGEKFISEVTKDIPTDIVLVLDQSTSMNQCMVCGNVITEADQVRPARYKKVYKDDLVQTKTYYLFGNEGYPVKYVTNFQQFFDGKPAGEQSNTWVCYFYAQGEDGVFRTLEVPVTPKSSESDNGKNTYQFFEATGYHKCSSRLSVLKDVLSGFVSSVEQKATGQNKPGTSDGIAHRIAMIGFASGNEESENYKNTELFIGGVEYPYNNTTTDGQYANALQDMRTKEGRDNITASIEALSADGLTRTDLGVEMAEKVLDACKNDTGRNKVVIVFTDGMPGHINVDDETKKETPYRDEVANPAIEAAHTVKTKYGATVYTVGIFEGANASSPASLPGFEKTVNGDWTYNAANRFMHLLSSNYPNATNMNMPGTVNPNLGSDSYYLSARNSAALNSVFQQISQQVEQGGAGTRLDTSTVIKDIIAPEFKLLSGKASDITLDTYKYNGENSWEKNSGAIGAKATVTGDTVSVTGFNFSDNWCGMVKDANGKEAVREGGNKLVICFKVKPKDGFLGGNNVFTNTSADVYESASANDPVLTFNRPQVNVPIKNVTVTAKDKNVYLLNGLTAEQLRSGATAKVGNVELDLNPNADNYGLEEWQNVYVDISVVITDAEGNAVSPNLTGLRDDTTYQVAVKVSPKKAALSISNGNAAVTQSGSDEAAINVFKPQLTYQDSKVWYGGDAPTDYSGNLTKETWINSDGSKKHDDKGVQMLNEKPTLTLSYTPEAGKITTDGKVNTKQDIGVNASVKIGEKDVTADTTFLHTACAPACGWNETTLDGTPAFLLHVQTCQLIISKTGGASDEPYVFTVMKDGEKYTEVTIVGNTEETICELPVGTYTIKEDTGWSWRYNADDSGSAELTASAPSGSIACSNRKVKDYWLNGFSDVVKNILGSRH